MRSAFIVLLMFLVAAPALAAVPATLSYQGVLRDDLGAVVPDDDYLIEFSIYDVSSGGTALWHRTRTVNVADGVFNVILGESAALNLAFNVPYWLGIDVEGQGELTPRVELTSAPYARRAAVADSLAGGAPADGDWTISGDHVYRFGNVSIGTGTEASKLTLYSTEWDDHIQLMRLGNQTGHISVGSNNMILWTGSASGLYVAGNGNIGVGVPSPANKLEVDGTTATQGFQMTPGAAAGYVLTSDASGNGTWQLASGGIGGSGTPDYVPKFTGSTTLGDSPIRLNGTMVGINTSPGATLHVNGTMDVEDETVFHSDVYSTNLQSEGTLTLASGSVNRVHLDAAGNVGVGTMTPGALLDVNGTAKVNGLRMVTGAADGRILVSDASGNGTWQTLSNGLALPYAGSASSSDPAFAVTNTGTGEASKFTVQNAASSAAGVKGLSNGTGAAVEGYASGSANSAGKFVIGNPSSTGSAVYGQVLGSAGLAGEFDGDVEVDGTHSATTVETPDLHVTSLADVDGRLDVRGSSVAPAYVYSDCDTTDAAALLVEHMDASTMDAVGVWSRCFTDYDEGIGGRFDGATMGIEARAIPQNGGPYGHFRGVSAEANGAEAQSYGVYAEAAAVDYPTYGIEARATGNGAFNYGVYGYADGAVYGDWAGYFVGNVYVSGTLTEGGHRMTIDDPLDPEGGYLNHAAVHSDEMTNVYNGNAVLDARGEAWVELPEWLEALNGDFRYQLTPVGAPGPGLYVADEIRGNRFRIAGGEPGAKVSWQVTGVRIDPYAKVHPVEVRKPKQSDDAGLYLHPEAYGRDAGDGLADREARSRRER